MLPSCGRYSDSPVFISINIAEGGKNQQSKLIEDRCAVIETLPGLIKVIHSGVIRQNDV